MRRRAVGRIAASLIAVSVLGAACSGDDDAEPKDDVERSSSTSTTVEDTSTSSTASTTSSSVAVAEAAATSNTARSSRSTTPAPTPPDFPPSAPTGPPPTMAPTLPPTTVSAAPKPTGPHTFSCAAQGGSYVATLRQPWTDGNTETGTITVQAKNGSYQVKGNRGTTTSFTIVEVQLGGGGRCIEGSTTKIA